jgi:hypothetical protein
VAPDLLAPPATPSTAVPAVARTTPSVVAWTEQDEVIVGQMAKRQAITNPEGTVYSAKRFMGRRYDESVEDAKRMPYKLSKRENGDVAVTVHGKTLSPPEIGANALAFRQREGLYGICRSGLHHVLGPVYLIPQSFNKMSKLFPVNSRPKRTNQTRSRKCQ